MGLGLKRAVYRISKRLGLFRLSRQLTRRNLRILCYHGISLKDESRFRPGLFIDPEVFERRMQYLKDHRYPVLGLEEALAALDRGDLPDHATVITIDDGFYSTYSKAFPALRSRGLPATVYVTSYYSGYHQNPVFRLAVQYLFWATRKRALDLGSLGVGLEGLAAFEDEASKERVTWKVIDLGETAIPEAERRQLIDRLAAALEVDFQAVDRMRCLALMTGEEISEMAEAGIDIQLHTHRHRLPVEEAATRREIEENRASLSRFAKRPLRHFCYPSGLWSEKHWPWLQSVGVASATTCDLGFNDPSTPKLALKRFLDGANIEQIDFEAEMSGFAELMRRGREQVRRLQNGLRGRQVIAAGG